MHEREWGWRRARGQILGGLEGGWGTHDGSEGGWGTVGKGRGMRDREWGIGKKGRRARSRDGEWGRR